MVSGLTQAVDPSWNLAESLFRGWVQHFAAADRQLEWLHLEEECSVWLDERTLLVGRIDAVGLGEGEPFFAEWKTQGHPPISRLNDWKHDWRMSPQALTYGILADTLVPGIRRFTVRKAFKNVPRGGRAYDYEWFRYGDDEIKWWRSELFRIAGEIREFRQFYREGPWAPNFTSCNKYGLKYLCPFFERACSRLDWAGKPVEWEPRKPHLMVEAKFLAENGGGLGELLTRGVVILDATRTETWLGCRERYRRQYEDGISEVKGEALQVGSYLHELLKRYYSQHLKKENGQC